MESWGTTTSKTNYQEETSGWGATNTEENKDDTIGNGWGNSTQNKDDGT